MAAVLELADGTMVVIDGDVAPLALRELEVWALVPDGADDEDLRDASVWKNALEAGPLLYVVYQGVVGNAAWSVFPAAARYLKQVLLRRPTPFDASTATVRVIAAAALATRADESDLSVEVVERDGEGCWRATLRSADGDRVKARLDPSGTITHIRVVRRDRD